MTGQNVSHIGYQDIWNMFEGKKTIYIIPTTLCSNQKFHIINNPMRTRKRQPSPRMPPKLCKNLFELFVFYTNSFFNAHENVNFATFPRNTACFCRLLYFYQIFLTQHLQNSLFRYFSIVFFHFPIYNRNFSMFAVEKQRLFS